MRTGGGEDRCRGQKELCLPSLEAECGVRGEQTVVVLKCSVCVDAVREPASCQLTDSF